MATARPLEDWPRHVVFSSKNDFSDRAARYKYRAGQLPSARKMIEWAAAHDLRFTVDADGLRCERITEDRP